MQKAKVLTLNELKNQTKEDSSNLPKTGLFGMKFMREAIATKRQEAKESAESLLKDLAHIDKTLDGDDPQAESEPEAPVEKARSAEEQAQLRAEVDAILAEDEFHDSVAVAAPKALNVKSKRLEKVMEASKIAVEEQAEKVSKRKKRRRGKDKSESEKLKPPRRKLSRRTPGLNLNPPRRSQIHG